MILNALTIFHVALSLVGIGSGVVAIHGLLKAKTPGRWTQVFLATTAATSLTGFFFPFHGFTPAIGLGLISLPILALTIYARYPKNLAGAWRLIYVLGAVISLYFNVFVGVVQSFEKIPALTALAPTQSDPPFKLTQLVVLALLVVLTFVAAIRFRPEPLRVQ